MHTIKLNVVFTGVCSYEAVNVVGDRAREVRFMMPNARKWRVSANDPDFLIPPHHPFLIVRESEVARRDETGNWKGRKPSGRLFDRWVYWMLRDETLRIVEKTKECEKRPKDARDVKLGNTANVVRLRDLCGDDARVDPSCSEGRSGRVASRFVFQRGRLSQRRLTTETFRFRRCDGTYTRPQELADEIQMALRGVRLIGSELTISTRRLDDEDDDETSIEPRKRDAIILRPTRPLLDIYAGSAPEADLAAVVGGAPNHDHGNANLHFEYHYEMSRRNLDVFPVPERVAKATTGPIGGNDRCPPSNGG